MIRSPLEIPTDDVLPKTREAVAGSVRDTLTNIPETPNDATINTVRDETRKRLDIVLEDIGTAEIGGIRILDHGITNTPLFRLGEYLNKTRERVLACLEFPKDKETPDIWTEVQSASADVLRLEQFAARVRAVKVFEVNAIPHDVPESEKREGQPAVEIPESPGYKGARGLFDTKANMIAVNTSYGAQTAKDVLQHEAGHAILDAVELHLVPDFFKRIIDRQQKALDDRDAFSGTLDTLRKTRARYAARPREETLDTVAERYVRIRYPRPGEEPVALPEDENESKAFEILEAASPMLDRVKVSNGFHRRMLEEVQKPTGFVDMAAVETALRDLKSQPDATLQYFYGGDNADLRFLVIQLLDRFDQWRKGETWKYQGNLLTGFTNVKELALFRTLETAFETHVAEQVKGAADTLNTRARNSQIFDTLLLKLSTGTPGAVPQYMPYGTDKQLLMEELINRFNDYRQAVDQKNDRELDTFGPDEKALFTLLDPSINRESTETDAGPDAAIGAAGEDVDRHNRRKGVLYSATASASADADDAGQSNKNTEEVEDSEVDVVKDAIDTLEDGMKKLIGLCESAAQKLESKHGDKKMAENYRQNTAAFAEGLSAIGGLRKALTLGSRWRTPPRVSPADFLNLLLPSAIDPGKSPNAHADFLKIVTAATQNGHWKPDDSPEMKEMHLAVDEILKQIENKVKTMQEEVDKISESAKTILDTEDLSGGTWRLKWYSLNHLIKAVQDVYASHKKAWEQWSTLRTTEIANRLGHIASGLPFGSQAKVTLEMDLDHKNDEIKDEYKKHLEHDLAPFDHCFDEHHHAHSLVHTNMNDPNRFRGTLEYMAGNGWLYDLNALKGTAFGIRLEDHLPPTWPKLRKDQYIRDLEQQNSSGEESAAKKGTSRVDTYPDIPPMMQVLDDEMKRHNFWAAKGILERAIQKGKTGHTSTWASTIILNAIRRDNITRKYFPKGLLDQLGNIGISSPAWASTFFKLDRNPLRKFQDNLAEFKSAGVLAKTLLSVETEILRIRRQSGERELDPKKNPEDRKLLDELTGKVLATQIVGKDGDDSKEWNQTISIYDDYPHFKEYRDAIRTFKGSLEPGKCDDDFYNGIDNGTSEALLKSAANFDDIFQPKSQGTFVYASKANFFLEQIIYGFDIYKKRIQDAEKRGDTQAAARARQSLQIYRNEMREKMDYVAKNSWKQGTAGLIVNIKGRCSFDANGKRTRESKDDMIYELVRRRMLSTPDELLDQLGVKPDKDGKMKDYDFTTGLRNQIDKKGVINFIEI